MITCLPKSICSWNFQVVRSNTSLATIETRFLSEQGSIHIADEVLNIQKKGMLTGHWSLEHDGNPIAEAIKESVFLRTFELRFEDKTLVLKAKTAFTRGFQIMFDQQCIGTIEPMHAFTRRARIDCSDAIPVSIQLFCFWLAIMTWRRAQNKNSGA